MAKKESYLWTSYSDLMTSLFFVMLILFVLSLVIVKHNNTEIIKQNEELTLLKDSLSRALTDAKVTIEEQKRIIRIDEQFRPLQESGVFKYYENSKKFVARDLLGVEIFAPDKADILPKYRDKTVEVGEAVKSTLEKLHKDYPDFKYLLVIEGNVANTYDHRFDKDDINGYMLSYKRALAVYQLWKNHNINLRKFYTEILICGSGCNGLDRDVVEEYNKRFSIQIIPKVSPKITQKGVKNQQVK